MKCKIFSFTPLFCGIFSALHFKSQVIFPCSLLDCHQLKNTTWKRNPLKQKISWKQTKKPPKNKNQKKNKTLMYHIEPPLHNQPSLKDLFQAGSSLLDSQGTVGRHVLMLQGCPGICPVEPDCLTAPALWRKWGWGGPLRPSKAQAIAVEVEPWPPADF